MPYLFRLLLLFSALSVSFSIHHQIGHAQQDADSARAQAGDYFREGEAAFRKGLYSKALEYFQKSNALFPHPVNLFNIARTHERLGDGRACIDGYEAYLDVYRRANAGKNPDDTTEVNAAITKCRLLLAPEITIETEPAGATVSIDNEDKILGQTPTTIALEPGQYTLYLNSPGYAPFKQQIEVLPGRPLKLHFKLEQFRSLGSVRVKSNIRDAGIFIDGRNIGLTPYREPIELSVGRHQVTVRKDDYNSYSEDIEISEAEETLVIAELFLADNPNTWKTPVGWTALSLGIATGVGGYFAGWQADKFFSDSDDFKQWSGLQTIGYAAGGTLIGLGLALIIWDAVDDSSVKSADALDTLSHAPSFRPFVTLDGRVGADITF